MKKALIALGFLGMLSAPRLAHADTKLAFVDLQRALEETEDGKKAKNKLKADFERKQKELDSKTEELKSAKESFDKKAPLMKPESLAKEQKDLEQRFVELQQMHARLQKDLAGKEQEAMSGVMNKMQKAVAQIAEREKIQLVLERNSSVVWGQASLDITNEVIRLTNSMEGSATPAKSKK